VRDVIVPPEVVVQTEHSDRVQAERPRDPQRHPRVETDSVVASQERRHERHREGDGRVHDHAQRQRDEPDDEYDADRRLKQSAEDVLQRRRVLESASHHML